MIRVYWNIGTAEDGLVWSVDLGDISSEINVKKIEIAPGVESKSNEDLSAEWPNPKGWFECHGCNLSIENQIARITLAHTV